MFRLRQRDAERAYAHNTAAGRQEWQFEVQSFLRGHPEYDGDQVLWDALDATVKRLANEADQQGNFINADKDAQWFLEEAHRQVAARGRHARRCPRRRRGPA